MNFHLRVDATTPHEVRCSLIANGQRSGILTMNHAEYSAFGRALLIGARGIVPPTIVNVDTAAVPARQYDGEGVA